MVEITRPSLAGSILPRMTNELSKLKIDAQPLTTEELEVLKKTLEVMISQTLVQFPGAGKQGKVDLAVDKVFNQLVKKGKIADKRADKLWEIVFNLLQPKIEKILMEEACRTDKKRPSLAGSILPRMQKELGALKIDGQPLTAAEIEIIMKTLSFMIAKTLDQFPGPGKQGQVDKTVEKAFDKAVKQAKININRADKLWEMVFNVLQPNIERILMEEACPPLHSISSITPNMIRRGAVTVVTISGSKLPARPKIEFTFGGQTTDKLRLSEPPVVAGNTGLRIKLAAANDALPGAYQLKLTNGDHDYLSATGALAVSSEGDGLRPVKVTPSTVDAGKKASFKIEFGEDLPLGKLRFGKSSLVPNGLPITHTAADRRWLRTGEVTIPANLEGKHKLVLENEKGEKVSEIDIMVNRKPVSLFDRFLSMSRRLRLESSVLLGGGNVDGKSSFEDRVAPNFGFKVSINPRWKPGDFRLAAEAEGRIEGNVSGTYRGGVAVGADARYSRLRQAQPFVSGDYQFLASHFATPTPFHANSLDNTFTLKAGVRSDVSVLSFSPYYQVRLNKFFSHQFRNSAGVDFNYDGTESVPLGGGIDITARFRKLNQHRLVPNLFLSAEGGKGKADVQFPIYANGSVIDRRQTATDYTEALVSGRLDWKTFYLTGDFSFQNYADFMNRYHYSGGAGLRTQKAGNFEARYHRWEINPNTPKSMDGVQVIWQAPWLNRSFSLNSLFSTEGQTVTLGVDLMRLISSTHEHENASKRRSAGGFHGSKGAVRAPRGVEDQIKDEAADEQPVVSRQPVKEESKKMSELLAFLQEKCSEMASPKECYDEIRPLITEAVTRANIDEMVSHREMRIVSNQALETRKQEAANKPAPKAEPKKTGKLDADDK